MGEGRGRVNPPTTLSETMAVAKDPNFDLLTCNLHSIEFYW